MVFSVLKIKIYLKFKRIK